MKDIKFETIDGTLCLMVEQPCPHCGQPEIIALPVVDGSKEWALYQMMQGKMVCQKDSYFKRYYRDGKVCWLDRTGIERSLTVELFLKNFDNTMDWQIYKPEQEPNC